MNTAGDEEVVVKALKLSSGEEVLDGLETLTGFVLDNAGAIGLDCQVLRRVLASIVRALNSEHEQVASLVADSDDVHGELYAMKEQSNSIERNLSVVSDEVTEIKIELGKVVARLDSVQKYVSRERDESGMEAQLAKLQADVQSLQESSQDVAERFAVTEKDQREDSKKFSSQIRDCEDVLARHSAVLDEEFGPRLHELDDSMLSLKLDVESCQASLTETNKAKASKSDLADMQKTLKAMVLEVEQDHHTLQEAAANLGKLDTCITMATENKARSEDLWRVFRQETQELREWSSRALGEVREQLQQKLERSVGMAHIEELQQDLRARTSQLAEIAARAEAEVIRKADLGDLQRLQGIVSEFRSRAERQTQRLIVGTKCIACDRDLPMEAVADHAAIDNAKLYQQEELWREVQKVLVEHQTVTPGLGQDILKMIAVKVGSPRRTGTVSGLGPFEVRDDVGGGAAQDSYQLVNPSRGPRPLSRPVEHTDLPPRMQAREAPPLMRVPPRRAPETMRASTAPSAHFGRVFQRRPSTTHNSVRAALGRTAPPTPRSSAVCTTPPLPGLQATPPGFSDGPGGEQDVWDDPASGRLPTLTQPSASGMGGEGTQF